jgi:ketosteroid isomerase-like protein
MTTLNEKKNQSISLDKVRTLFKNLEQGDGAEFFTKVADDVDWIVEGHHPLAGHYLSKSDFLAGTFAKLGKVLPSGTQLHVTNAMLCGDWAVVELASLATAKNGLRFDNKYCWLCRFENGKIVEVRAYLDSAMVQRLFDENHT